MKRGEIYWADLAPRSGSEQQGRRPVVIISHDLFNRARNWKSIIVIPLTTSANQSARGPSVVALPKGTAGLPQDSVVVCHQVTTLDRNKISQRLGELGSVELMKIENALKAAMDLN